MAKFKFRLKQILELKIKMEDNLKNELGKAQRKLAEEEKLLEYLKLLEEENIKDFNLQANKGISVDHLKMHISYISLIRGKIALQKENVNYAQHVVDKVRGELIKIMQERKILDKLREKKFNLFKKEQAKLEQKLNDEIISYKLGCNSTGVRNE